MNLETANNVLIIRLSSLGDVILTTPVIRALKKKYPQKTFSFLVKKAYSDAVKYNPNISKIFVYNKENIKNTIKELEQNDFDFVIDLQNNFRSSEVVKALCKPFAKFSKPSIKKFLLVNFKIDLFKEIKTIPEMYASAINSFQLDNYGPDIFLPDSLKSQITKDKKNVGLCPGSKHFTKMWPQECFIELGNNLSEKKINIFLFGGKDDINVCREISNQINGSVDLANNNDLLQTAMNMSMCNIVVCNDSGLMHTACAAKTDVLAIFGSTVRQFGFFPYNSTNTVLENNSLSCRPCSHIGRSKCPQGHLKCLTEITPEMVFNCIKGKLNIS
ncbi:MAG: glycosyltransferase family 9 protein [Ignavibacteria bacterium]